MVCNHCGAALDGQVKFCGSCGQAVIGTSSLTSRCACGVELNPNMKFCVSCGRPSSASQALPPAFAPGAKPLPLPPSQMMFQTPSQPFSPPSAIYPTEDYYSSLHPPSPVNHQPTSGSQPLTELKEQSSAGQKISLSAAIIGVICFFLPWVEVSCVGWRKSASGLQLATDMELPEIWVVLLVLLAAAAFILVQLFAKTLSETTAKLLNIGVIGAGLLPLLIFLYEYTRFSNEVSKVKNSAPFGMGQLLGGAIENSVSYQFGGILSVIVSVAVALGGALHLLNKRKRNK
ncbi:MAG: zinc ribbon domain-containing protein [Acidobacteria bacterium]|nr:zinc ribbon domain-containing protein [Acidobacteriota bacterium]